MASTRDRLLTSTNELFRTHGLNGTSLKQVTEAAGAPIGSLYHHFPGGKEELAEAVLRTSGATYQALFEMIADAAADPAAAVTDFFEGAAAVLEETDFIDICPIGTVAREVASTSERLREASQTVFDGWFAAMAGRLEAAGVPSVDAVDLARTTVATLEGCFMLARTARDATVLRTAGRHVRSMVEGALAEVPTGSG